MVSVFCLKIFAETDLSLFQVREMLSMMSPCLCNNLSFELGSSEKLSVPHETPPIVVFRTSSGMVAYSGMSRDGYVTTSETASFVA